MSNGGYKGNTPARETSPEQYPGVWGLSEQFQAQADGNWPFQETDCAPKSLKIGANDGKLSRTPLMTGNASVFTLSCWVKRTLATNYDELLSIDPQFGIRFTNTDKLHLDLYAPDGSSWAVIADSKAVFRDPSAWYSIILVLDSNAGTTNADRLKLWVNGEPSEFDFTVYWGGLITGNVAKLHTVVEHTIGMRGSTLSGDFLIADYHFLDGQAVYPEEFGFFDGAGVWQPKRFTGDYGPKTTTYTGVTTGGDQYNGPYSNVFDGDPASRVLTYTSTSTKLTLDSPPAWAYKIEIRALRYGGVFEINGIDISGLAWTSSAQYLDATSLLGGSGTLQTIEVGDVGSNYVALYSIKLDGAELIQPTLGGNNSFHLDFSDGVKDQSGSGNDWTPQNLHFPSPDTASYYTTSTLYSTLAEVLANGTNRGQSGFTLSSAEFVYIVPGKGGIDGQLAHGAGTTWSSPYVYANKSNNGHPWKYTGGYGDAEAALQYWYDDATDTSGGEHPYAYGSDIPMYLLGDERNNVTGAGYQPTTSSSFDSGTVFPPLINTANNNPSTGDLLVDSPVNGNQTDPSGLGGIVQGNYATWNPLTSVATLTKGNLLAIGTAAAYQNATSSIAVKQGKWYAEFKFVISGTAYPGFGIADINSAAASNSGYTSYMGVEAKTYAYFPSLGWYSPETVPAYNSASIVTGDIIGLALDLDSATKTLKTYINGTLDNTVNIVDPDGGYVFGTVLYFAGSSATANFGQRPFKHPLAGYKSLCTSNLPEPSIPVPSQYFDAFLYSGNGASSRDITLPLAADFLWIKKRSAAQSHQLADTVRGDNAVLRTNSNLEERNPQTEYSGGGISSISGTTATLSSGTSSNDNANAINSRLSVWAWDAGEATTTIAAGSLNSSAYDQTQTWSGSVTSDNGFAGTQYGATQAFNGTTSGNHTASNSNGTLTFAPNLTIPANSVIEIHAGSGSTAYMDVTVNGVANNSTAGGAFVQINYDNSTTLTSLTITRTGGNNSADLRGLKINGVLLVDPGASVANVPSIASTVRSSPESGFSIIKYNGSGSNGSIAHGLNKAPAFFFGRNLNDTTTNLDWIIYHRDIGNTGRLKFSLNSVSTSSTFFQDTTPSNSVISIGTSNDINKLNDDYIIYAFEEIENYSSMGKYIGNGSDEGPFLYTGFKPRVIFTKAYSANSDNQSHWLIYDTLSDSNPYNEADTVLYANLSNDLNTHSSMGIDILSNGFRLKADTSGYSNYTGYEYVYFAIAEHPFKNSRAR